MTAPHPSPPRPTSESALARDFAARAFFVAWATATLFHQLSVLRVAGDLLDTALSLSAFAVIAMPRRTALFALLLGLQVVEIWAGAPVISNHWWTSMFVATGCLGALALCVRRGEFDAARWRAAFEPMARAILVVVYVWGVLHKLNSDFLDPAVSCGGELYETLRADYLPFVPASAAMSWASVVVTLVVELSIPLLLLFGRTRRWGVVLGTSFHFMLGFVPYSVYYNFSSMLFALYLLYTGPHWLWRAREAWMTRTRAPQREWVRRLLLLAVLVFLALAGWLGPNARETWRFAPRIWWLAYGGLAVAAYLRFGGDEARTNAEGSSPPAAAASHWSLLLIALAFLLNGASPYFGIKTETSLAMYSNLRTENGESNHLFFPGAMDLTQRQADVVTIKRSSSRKLRRLERDNQGIVWWEFRDYLARNPKTSVTFIRGGVQEKLKRAGDDPRFAERAPKWERKLVYFRPVDQGERQRCMH